MHALVSVPGGILKRSWKGSILPGELIGDLVDDETIIACFSDLKAHLAEFGIETAIIARPEIISAPQATNYILERVPDLCGHIYIGPPHLLKYLKGVENLGCFSPIRSMGEAQQILGQFEYNPNRLRSLRACLNGYSVATLLADRNHLNRPILLPRRSLVDKSAQGRGFVDTLATTLFLNNHDANNSAQVMMSRLRPLTEHLASRRENFERANIYLTQLAPHRDLPTGIAAALRDLAYLAVAGMNLTLLVLIEDAKSLTFDMLETVAQRLNASLAMAGFHAGLVDSSAVIIAPGEQPLGRLLTLTSNIFLFDFDWPESAIAQIALQSGVKPVFLSNAHPDLKEMFAEIADVIPHEVHHSRRVASGVVPFGYPQAGSIQKFVTHTISARLPSDSRTTNSRHVHRVFEHALSRMKNALGMNGRYDIRFN